MKDVDKNWSHHEEIIITHWNMLPYDNSNYAWTLQRNASPNASFHPNYKWTLYERTETISSNDPDC